MQACSSTRVRLNQAPQGSARLAAPAFGCRPCPLRFRAGHAAALRQEQPGTAAERSGRRAVMAQAVARPSVFLFGFGGGDDEYDEDYTVLKVQVGMFGDIKRWQKEMERLSELYDTEDEESLHFILQETVTKLLRNMEYVSYGATAGKVFDTLEACERKFNEVSMEERSKFKEETYVNVDGRRRSGSLSPSATPGDTLDNWLCITLLVAAEGKLVLPKINSLPDLRKALTTLGSVTPETVLAFELMWTPQAEGDSYTRDELMTDFPTLALL